MKEVELSKAGEQCCPLSDMEIASRLFDCAYADGIAKMAAREAALLVGGITTGAINEIKRQPDLAISDLCLTGSIAVGTASMLMVDAPVAAAAAGATVFGLWASERLTDPETPRRLSQVKHAMAATALSDDPAIFQRSLLECQQALGPLGRDMAIGTLAFVLPVTGAVAFKGLRLLSPAEQASEQLFGRLPRSLHGKVRTLSGEQAEQELSGRLRAPSDRKTYAEYKSERLSRLPEASGAESLDRNRATWRRSDRLKLRQ